MGLVFFSRLALASQGLAAGRGDCFVAGTEETDGFRTARTVLTTDGFCLHWAVSMRAGDCDVEGGWGIEMDPDRFKTEERL